MRAASPGAASDPLAAAARRLLVIRNPAAGRRSRAAAALAALRDQGVALSVRETAARGDAEALAREAADFDAIVVAGGDGTTNETINGLLARDPCQPAPALGIIPAGTANVLARELGIPAHPRRLAALIARGEARTIHVGEVNGRHFALMVGVGFDARVVSGVNVRLKRRIGRAAYAVEIMREATRHRAQRYQVHIDGGPPIEAASVIVTKSRLYGGGFRLAGEASVRTPTLHVCLFLRGGRFGLLRYLLALGTGRLAHAPGYRVVPARMVVISGPDGETAQADGDACAQLPLTIGVAQRPLAVIAP